jgi:hypothetical protein
MTVILQYITDMTIQRKRKRSRSSSRHDPASYINKISTVKLLSPTVQILEFLKSGGPIPPPYSVFRTSAQCRRPNQANPNNLQKLCQEQKIKTEVLYGSI